jgi:hypothetical protein
MGTRAFSFSMGNRTQLTFNTSIRYFRLIAPLLDHSRYDYRTTRHITGSALVLSPLLFSMSLILYSTIKRVRRLCLLILGILLPLVGSRAMDDGSHGSGSTFVLTPLLRRRFNYLFGPKVQL